MNHLLLDDDRPGTRRVRYAAAASAAAGVVHVAAAVPHFTDDPLLGGVFVMVGWLQVLLASLLLRGHVGRGVLVSGLLLHLASLAGWAVSRTVGLLLGHPGAEPVALPDLLTVAFEVVAFGLITWRLARPEGRRLRRPLVLAGLVGSWLVVMAGSAVAISDLALGGHGHDDTMAVADGHDDADDGHHDEDAGGHGAASGEPDGESSEASEHAASAPDRDDDVHIHEDRSVHVHTAGEAHEHTDGSVHIHRLASGDSPVEQGSEAADDEDGSHMHAPGEEH